MTVTLWKCLIAGFLFAACAFLSVAAVGQAKPTQNVLVVNGAGQPVPTAAQGTTNVAGTVGLAAGSIVNVGNTPNVNVANTPSVNVTNTPAVSLAAGASVNVTNPLDSQNNPTPLAVLEATQPYESTCTLSIGGFLFGVCTFQSIPSGKRLVVQEFDALGELVPPGLKPVAVSWSHATFGIAHYFTATFMGTSNSGSDFYATHQETRLYANPGDSPACTVTVNGNSNSTYICQISGFLVDVPQ